MILDANFATGSPPPNYGFTISTPSDQTVAQGATATFSFNVDATSGSPPPILLGLQSSYPEDQFYPFFPVNPLNLPSSGSASDSVSAPTGCLSPGTYGGFQMTGTAGPVSATSPGTFTLTITPNNSGSSPCQSGGKSQNHCDSDILHCLSLYVNLACSQPCLIPPYVLTPLSLASCYPQCDWPSPGLTSVVDEVNLTIIPVQNLTLGNFSYTFSMACAYCSNLGVSSSQARMLYWTGGEWHRASNVTVSNDTISGAILLSGGSVPIVIGVASSATVDYIPSIIVAAAVVVVAVVLVSALFLRRSNRVVR